MFIHASRRLIGMVLGLIAAVAAVWSAFISWYAGREGSNIQIQDLFASSITLENASTMNSLFLPLAFAALLCVVYAVVGWRSLLILGGLVCIATTMLWGTRQAQTSAGLHADLVGYGPQLAFAAGVLMLIAAAVAPPPKRRPATTAEPEPVGATTGQPTGQPHGTTRQRAYAAGYTDAQSEASTDDAQTKEPSGEPQGTTRQRAYAAGYRDAQSEASTDDAQTKQPTSQQSAPKKQQPNEPPTRQDDPNP